MARTVTPDGRFVLGYALSSAPPTPGLYPVGGGEPKPVPFLEPSDTVLRWSADATALYVSRSRRPRQIERLDLATGRRQLLHEIQPIDPAGIGEIVHRTLSTLFLVDGLR